MVVEVNFIFKIMRLLFLFLCAIIFCNSDYVQNVFM